MHIVCWILMGVGIALMSLGAVLEVLTPEGSAMPIGGLFIIAGIPFLGIGAILLIFVQLL